MSTSSAPPAVPPTGVSEPRLDARTRWSIRLGALLLRALASTWRISVHGRRPHRERMRRGEGAVVLSLWHGQMLPILVAHRGEPCRVLVSEHRDGEIITQILASFGFSAERGSSTRGGLRALIGLVQRVRAGDDIAVTPDGPRGPRHSIAPGVALIAQKTNAPIVPLVAHCSRYWQLKSWDAFEIPKPFARVTVLYDQPVAATDSVESTSAALQGAMANALVRCEALARGGQHAFTYRVWAGQGRGARIVRACLTPVAALFGVVVSARNARFDRGTGVRPTALPALSIGNLTVGGTGKTPVAAWCVGVLRSAGAAPAVVMRGVGDDEWRVHTLLNPGAPVIRTPDRVAGVEEAAAQGADVVVLDDAFQHRQAARAADVVLVSADSWGERIRLLPAGPWREPLHALRRATAVVITVKDPERAQVGAVRDAVERAAPGLPVVLVELCSDTLCHASDTGHAEPRRAPVSELRQQAVLAVSAIGNPEPFERALGRHAQSVTPVRFPDHHHFSASDVRQLVHAAARTDRVVCTLKDAVKLAPEWPASATPLWYLSQTVVVRENAEALHAVLDRLLALRGVRQVRTASR